MGVEKKREGKKRKEKKRKGNLTVAAGKEKRKERESYSDGRSRKSEWI